MMLSGIEKFEGYCNVHVALLWSCFSDHMLLFCCCDLVGNEMNRSVTGKGSVASDTFSGSETAARLADYSGTQYYYIPGGRPASDLTPQSATTMSNVNLPADSVDSGSEKDVASSKDQKPDNPSKDLAKVSVLCAANLLYRLTLG